MGETPAVKDAKTFLRVETYNPEDGLNLATKHLKQEKAFGDARRVLYKAGKHLDPHDKKTAELALKIAQQQALCTYKDQDLSIHKRFDHAVEILSKAHDRLNDPLGRTTNQETLGIMGAIHKYRWETSGRKHHLEQALNYYLRGAREGVPEDNGYTSVNAAFVLDLLASLEQDGLQAGDPNQDTVNDRRKEARNIREHTVSCLKEMMAQNHELDKDWWILATMGEACFGLEQWEDARAWFQQGLALGTVPDWEKESTARQLASLARCVCGERIWEKGFYSTQPGQVLGMLMGENAMYGMLLGKVGLALSGGGFRASLFHIGVLARLAELDLLRHVDVISCVSGGSIIGAHYYLELQNDLKHKTEEEMTHKAYIALVERVADTFLKGVQTNVRTRMASEFMGNLTMIWSKERSRTTRIGELYEEKIFSLVEDGHNNGQRSMKDLIVHPKDEEESFSPKHHNWRRNAKVPTLILNATTLNTGHNWQFTASWMGEPPTNIDADIDTNDRYRRMYYREAPKDKYKKFPLGKAVAASSCVPGLFEPVPLPDLYPQNNGETINVRLVDGGVHDNQGVASLIEQDCSVMLVSDASGQMESKNEPSRSILGVPMRTTEILQARIRETEYRELDSRKQAKALRGLMFIHLKKNLGSRNVSWKGCEDSDLSHGDVREETDHPIIDRNIQRALAKIRTDLDSFSESEAYALMLDGYHLTTQELRDPLKPDNDGPSNMKHPHPLNGLPPVDQTPHDWSFLQIDGAARNSTGHEAEHKELERILKAGEKRFFKLWDLDWKFKAVIIAFALAGMPLITMAVTWVPVVFMVLFSVVGVYAAVFLVTALLEKMGLNITWIKDMLVDVGLGIVLSLFGSLAAKVHLKIVDPWFLKYGTIEALHKRVGTPAQTSEVSQASTDERPTPS